MPERDRAGRLTAPLAHRLPDPSSAAAVAAAVAALWAELDAALTPIVGPRGVAALFQRSLHLAAATHPWLTAGQSAGPDALDPASISAQFARRSDEEAAQAADCFLQTFHQLLASLIGPSLTERLLRSVWGPPIAPTSGAPAQDPMS